MRTAPSNAKPAAISHFSHHHPLTLTTHPSGQSLTPLSCSCCTKRVSSAAYTCHFCKFFLHVECSELPPLVNHKLHPQHDLTLLHFKNPFICSACGEGSEGFAYSCAACSFHLHTGCSLMPMELASGSHHHPLFLRLVAPYPNHSFRCYLCDTISSHWLYRCDACQFDVHLNCATAAPPSPAPADYVMNSAMLTPPIGAPVGYIRPVNIGYATTASNGQGMVPAGPNYGGGGQAFQGAVPQIRGHAATQGAVLPNYVAGHPANYGTGGSPNYAVFGYVPSSSGYIAASSQAIPGYVHHSGAGTQVLPGYGSFSSGNGYSAEAISACVPCNSGYSGASQQGVPGYQQGNSIGSSLAGQILGSAVSGVAQGLVQSLLGGGSS